MSETPVPITDVRGGVGGLAVGYERARALAATFDTAGNRMRGWAGAGGRVLRDGDLLASALLSPVSFANAEVAVLEATTGPDGILVESVGWETDALLIRSTVWAFERTDLLVAATFEVVDYTAGRALGLTVALTLPALATSGLLVWGLTSVLPPPLRRGAADAAGRGSDALSRWLTEHPEVVEHLANGGGGLVDGFWTGVSGPLVGPDGEPLFHPTTESAAGLLAGFYPGDGGPEVTARGDLAPPARGAPASLADLLATLQDVSALSDTPDSPRNGTVEIQTLPGEPPVHVVYLPGADDLATTPWSADGDVRDQPTNLLAVSGTSTSYADGILESMRLAGIRPGEPVLLVGHSQGGIVASQLAAHPEGFQVAGVVTAGSPVAGQGPYPEGTHVLSLEHRGDVVPLVEGEPNADAANHVTVTFDDHEDDVAGNHDLAHYVRGAAAVDASDDPSLLAELARLTDAGFLGGDGDTRSQVFQITRRQD
ncbi:MAG: hypothetical protein ABIQ15_03865 [Nocardioides sp.]